MLSVVNIEDFPIVNAQLCREDELHILELSSTDPFLTFLGQSNWCVTSNKGFYSLFFATSLRGYHISYVNENMINFGPRMG